MGLELPNSRRETVRLSEILCSVNSLSSFELPLGIGKDIGGNPVVLDLVRMPHLLIAGTTFGKIGRDKQRFIVSDLQLNTQRCCLFS